MTITESIKFNKVKELIVKIKQEIKLCNSALALKTLENLINKYENELAEKDKEIKKLKSKYLFKEDFYLFCEEDKLTYDWESLQTDEITIEMHLKYCESNNHRYCLIKDINNLPSKLESKENKISWR